MSHGINVAFVGLVFYSQRNNKAGYGIRHTGSILYIVGKNVTIQKDIFLDNAYCSVLALKPT